MTEACCATTAQLFELGQLCKVSTRNRRTRAIRVEIDNYRMSQGRQSQRDLFYED